jgi:hypothetical protein
MALNVDDDDDDDDDDDESISCSVIWRSDEKNITRSVFIGSSFNSLQHEQ